MKKLLSLLLAVLLLATMIGCGQKKETNSDNSAGTQAQEKDTQKEGSGDDSAKAEFVFKLGHTGAPTHHYQTISLLFAERVKERTGGKVVVEVFPSDQLGNQMESIEGTMVGTQDMVLTSDMALSNWTPEVGIFNLPYIFRDDAHTRLVFDGPIGQKFSDLVAPTGATVLAWWDGGLRHVTNNKKAINTPADMDGIKIRVPEGDIYLETFKAFGANPTVLGMSEVYSALQLNTVDAQENPPAHILAQKFYEVQKYVSKTQHIRSSSPLLVNTKKFKDMPDELQKIMIDTAQELGAEHNKIVQELEAAQWKELAELGMEINEPDLQAFKDSVEPVYEHFSKILDKELIDEVRNAK